MRQIIVLIFLLIAATVQADTGTVVRVVDGDTIKIANEHGIATVRLYGIDAPEKSQAFGQAARGFTSQMVEGRVIDYTPIDTDRYGRTVAIVMIGTQCLQEQLIFQGYAWVYPQYCKERFCQAWTTLQGISAGNRVGLWIDPAPVQPWVWRKQAR